METQGKWKSRFGVDMSEILVLVYETVKEYSKKEKEL